MLFAVPSCKKDKHTPIDEIEKEKEKEEDKKKDPDPVHAEVGLDKTEAVPGEFFELTFNTGVFSKDTVHALLGGKTVVLYKTENKKYSGTVPALPAGDHSFSFTGVKLTKPLSIKVSTYTAITNAEPIISGHLDYMDDSIEELLKLNGPEESKEVMSLLNGLKTKFDQAVKKLTEAEKLELAYLISAYKAEKPLPLQVIPTRQISPLMQNSPSVQRSTLIQSSPIINSVEPGKSGSMENLLEKFAADLLKLKQGVIAMAAAANLNVKTFKVIDLSMTQYTSAIAAFSFSAYIVKREFTRIKIKQVQEYKALPARLTELVLGKPGTSGQNGEPPLFYRDEARTIDVETAFESLAREHEKHSSGVIKQALANMDEAVRIDKMIAGRSSTLLDDLPGKGKYTPMDNTLPAKPKSVTDLAPIKNISISRVSDKYIALTLASEEDQIKIKATSETIATKTDFNFDVSFKHQGLDINISKKFDAIFDLNPIYYNNGKLIPATLEIVDGNEQQGKPDRELDKRLKVKVTDGKGKAMKGIDVSWKVLAGAGSLSASTSKTDDAGFAEITWTMGGYTTKIDHRVEASVIKTEAMVETPAVFITQTFTSTFHKSVFPAKIEIINGDDQQGRPKIPLRNPLKVKVVNSDGEGLKGVDVSWKVLAGGGSLGTSTSISDYQGIAEVSWTMGPYSTTSEHRIEVKVTGAEATAETSAVTFTEIFKATLDDDIFPAKIEITAGNNQQGKAGQQLNQGLQVKVTNAKGLGIEDIEVVWKVSDATGSVSPGTSTTGPTGISNAIWKLGKESNVQEVEAVVYGKGGVIVPKVMFTARLGNPLLGKWIFKYTTQKDYTDGVFDAEYSKKYSHSRTYWKFNDTSIEESRYDEDRGSLRSTTSTYALSPDQKSFIIKCTNPEEADCEDAKWKIIELSATKLIVEAIFTWSEEGTHLKEIHYHELERQQ